MIFENREEAGRKLAVKLSKYRAEKPLVLALPRGGVPVGFEIAEKLGASLDVLISRKIGAPHNPEFGIGAVAEGNIRVLDKPVIRLLNISKEDLETVSNEEKRELVRRAELYRSNQPLPSFKNRIIILVDDGLATGVTARAAIKALKKQNPKKIVFASPVCAYDTAGEFRHLVDDVVCVSTPVDFESVGLWYRNFDQVTDREVINLLHQSKERKSDISGVYQRNRHF